MINERTIAEIEARQDRIDRRIDEKLEAARVMAAELLDVLTQPADEPLAGEEPGTPDGVAGSSPEFAQLAERAVRIGEAQAGRIQRGQELARALVDGLQPDTAARAAVKRTSELARQLADTGPLPDLPTDSQLCLEARLLRVAEAQRIRIERASVLINEAIDILTKPAEAQS